MHPVGQIQFVKNQIAAQAEPYYTAYRQLIHYADSIQAIPHHALADFAVPGYYDKPQEHRNNSLAIQHDAFGAYCSALAYVLSGEEHYGTKACYFLDAWAGTNKKYSEHDGVLVMVYSGTGLLMAGELMQDSPVWREGGKQQFLAWVSDVYRHAAHEIRVHKNNWADWGRFGSLLAASLLDDRDDVEENVRLIKSDLFGKILPDGSMPEETRRGDNGIWYTYFSLAPMTAACWLVHNLTGEDLFHLEQDGTSIRKAIDYMAYHNYHPTEWRWHENVRSGQQEYWPENLLEAMSGIFGKSEYDSQIRQNRPIIYPIHHFAWVFPTLMPLTLHK